MVDICVQMTNNWIDELEEENKELKKEISRLKKENKIMRTSLTYIKNECNLGLKVIEDG